MAKATYPTCARYPHRAGIVLHDQETVVVFLQNGYEQGAGENEKYGQYLLLSDLGSIFIKVAT